MYDILNATDMQIAWQATVSSLLTFTLSTRYICYGYVFI